MARRLVCQPTCCAASKESGGTIDLKSSRVRLHSSQSYFSRSMSSPFTSVAQSIQQQFVYSCVGHMHMRPVILTFRRFIIHFVR
jgi:hypothetical protein